MVVSCVPQGLGPAEVPPSSHDSGAERSSGPLPTLTRLLAPARICQPEGWSWGFGETSNYCGYTQSRAYH